MSFKPSKDRYKHELLIQYLELRSCVSNPQRIATNEHSSTCIGISSFCFKPSKDRYKLGESSSAKKYLGGGFKPSKDRYKRRERTQGRRGILTGFKPSKDRYKRGEVMTAKVVTIQFQTLKGSLQTNQTEVPEDEDRRFQTLKGSLQTPPAVSSTSFTFRFKPSKDRYKPPSITASTGVRPVSNPQRIATNS